VILNFGNFDQEPILRLLNLGTTTYNASVVEGWSFFQSRIKYFCF
jgi:hypothetical protein